MVTKRDTQTKDVKRRLACEQSQTSRPGRSPRQERNPPAPPLPPPPSPQATEQLIFEDLFCLPVRSGANSGFVEIYSFTLVITFLG